MPETKSMLATCHPDYQHSPPGATAVVLMGDRICTTRLKEEIADQVHSPSIQYYMSSKYGWDRDTLLSIGSEGHSAAISKFSLLERITLVKCLHGWLATRKRQSRRKKGISPVCPLCNHVEDKHHLFTCTDKKMVTQHTKMMSRLTTLLKNSLKNDAAQAVIIGITTDLDNVDVNSFRMELSRTKISRSQW